MAITPAGLIGGLYEIDFTQTLPGAADQSAMRSPHAAGRTTGTMAVQVARGWPMRARELGALGGRSLRTCSPRWRMGRPPCPPATPATSSSARHPPAPPSPPPSAPWPEAELIEHVLKPACPGPGGPAGQAIDPPGHPPRQCVPGCPWSWPSRSDAPGPPRPPATSQAGSSRLARPHATPPAGATAPSPMTCTRWAPCWSCSHWAATPWQDLSDEAALLRKLEHGSYAALAGAHPPAPRDRRPRARHAGGRSGPSPVARLAGHAGRGQGQADRRPAHTARPAPDRGRRRLRLTTARGLAYALGRDQAGGRGGACATDVVDRWLRRGLGDALCAGHLEEAVRIRDAQAAAGNDQADPALIMCRGSAYSIRRRPTRVAIAAALWPRRPGPCAGSRHAPCAGQLGTLAEIVPWMASPTRWQGRRATRPDPGQLEHASVNCAAC